MDRRASYDDARGMGEGILDNRDTQHRYWLLFEAKTSKDKTNNADKVGLPTSLANAMSRRLSNPSVQFVCSARQAKSANLQDQVQLLNSPMDQDLHLFNLRTLSSEEDKPQAQALLILHKQGSDCQFDNDNRNDETKDKSIMPDFKELSISKWEKTTLTGLFSNQSKELKLQDMRLQTVKVNF